MSNAKRFEVNVNGYSRVVYPTMGQAEILAESFAAEGHVVKIVNATWGEPRCLLKDYSA